MAEFAELLKRRKAQGQAIEPIGAEVPEIAPDFAQPIGPQPEPQGEFRARLEQRKAEQELRDLGRQQFEQQPSLGQRIGEAFTGAARQTPAIEGLPEFRETEEIQAFAPRGIRNQLKLAAGLMTTFSPEGQMQIIKETIPESKFFQDEKGNIIIDIGGKRSLLNRPGMSGQDAVRAITTILGFAPASKIAQAGKTILAKFGIGAAGAAATEVGRQEVSRLAGFEEARDPKEIALAATLSGAAETVGPAFRALRGRRAASRAAATVPELVETGEDVARARDAVTGIKELTGVDVPLFQAQQTLIPSQLKLQRLLPQLDATSRQAANKLVTQNRKVAEAVDAVIETITPREVMGAPERFRTAAQKAIEAKNAARAEISSPLFRAAANDIVDSSPVVKMIDNELKLFPGKSQIKNTLEMLKENISKSRNIGKLQKTKAIIDDILNKTGEGRVSGDGRRIVQKVKEELLLAMDGAGAKTPEHAASIRKRVKAFIKQAQEGVPIPETKITGSDLPPYAQARIRFAQASPEVAELTEGVVGKLADLDNIQVESIANTLFNPRLRPSTIEQAKKIVDSVDPGAWNDILKYKVLDNMTKIRPPQAGAIENTAGKIRSAVFGNAQQKKALLAGMTAEQKKNFRWLDDMLDRASQGRFEGSPTASFQEALKNIRSVPLLLQKIFTLRASEIQRVGEQGLLNSRLRAVATSLFDDTWADEISAIRKMNPNSREAATRLGKLLSQIETVTKTTPQVIREEL